ncbi:30S ribosomal protein S9 [bacterium]|nr:30S ribosomal protein S9 [bacterium]
MAKTDTDFYWGTGRRKTAVARVRMRRGTGRIVVNDREVDAYFPTERARASVRAPLKTVKVMNRYDIFATIRGSGPTAQANAMLLGIARALVKIDPDFHQRLKDAGFLTRDSRRVERKKYGKRGARAGYQFSKR